jgi:PAS domain S-box-containing protein
MEVATSSDAPASPEVAHLRARLAELEQNAARRVREMTALHEVSLEIGQLTDLTTLLETIVKKAASLLNSHVGGLYLARAEDEKLELVVAYNLPGVSVGTTLNLGEGLSGRIARTGQPLMVPDYSSWEGRAAVYEGAPFRRVLGVPLKIGEKVIGVLNVTDDQRSGEFSEDEVRLVGLFAEQAALAVERARLLAEANRDLAERQRAGLIQASLYRISEAVHTAGNLDELYRSIHAIVSELMPARNFSIALHDGASDLITFPYLVDDYDDDSPIPLPGKGLTAYVLRTGQALFAPPEVFDDLVRRGEVELIGGPSVDWLGAPLKVHDKTIGVVAVQTYTPGVRLTEEHKDILIFVSSQIAMAIERKRSEEALRDSERHFRDLFVAAQRQTQELALLDRARTALTRELDLATVFRTIVTAIAETFGYTLVSLYKVEEDALILQHQVGYDYVINRIPLESGVTGRVARTGVPALLEDVNTDPTCLLAIDDIVSEVCVPLRDEGEVVGVLNVESTQGVKLSSADLQLMMALSEHINSAITRARLYTEARENAARLRTAIENLPFNFWALDKHGRYVLQNAASERRWGNRLGRRLSELQIDPAIVTQWEKKDRRAFAGEVVEIDVAYSLDGDMRFYHEISGPIRDGNEIVGILGVDIDVTDRRRAEEQLRDSEERYRLLFDSNPHPMWAYDLETLRFLTVNDAAVRHYGYSRAEFLNMTIADIRPAEDVPTLLVNVAQVTEGLDEAGVWRHRKKDGTLIEVEITSHTLMFDGRPAELVLATDVTERRRTEEALRRAQKMESLGLLAGGIAHDFNNLLVAILGQTSLALSRLNADNPARGPIEKAVTASRRAADLTRQLLAYSGRGQFERRPIDLNHLIQENLHLFEVAVLKNVALRSDLVEPLPPIVGDAGQLQQVIMNLIINAAEAIGQRAGLVLVRTRLQHITPEDVVWWQIGEEALLPGDYVLLTVEDNGEGMEAETLSRIFDPFFSTKFTGRGLGLAAVMGIVRGHGGGLKVISAPNVGTTFEIVLPVGTIEVAAPTIHAGLQETGATQQLVLLIDDEEPVRMAVTDILELEGLPVLSASDGRSGIELYRQRQADIGLIVLDLSMPGLSGEETFRELRQINGRARVLLSSGYSQDEVAARFAVHDDVGFIQKPYDADQLTRQVKHYLAQGG